jgi:N6-adenosine-specific RNA methylase IME4
MTVSTAGRWASSALELATQGLKFGTILVDPPWQFQHRTGKIAPEHHRLSRYFTLSLDDMCALPVSRLAAETSHLYLWVPNALLPNGLKVMEAWDFQYKSNIVWHKVRKDGGSDGRGVGFYFRNVTELLLFGVRGKGARTFDPGRRQVNMIASRKREHSRKPEEQYEIFEKCSPGPRIELFARGSRDQWTTWGNQNEDFDRPDQPVDINGSLSDALCRTETPKAGPFVTAKHTEPISQSGSNPVHRL